MRDDKLFIGGVWSPPSTDAFIEVVSPFTEQPVTSIAAVRRLATVYGDRKPEMAQIISSEIGAPISFAARAQVALPWTMIGAFCDLAEDHPGGSPE